MTTVTTVTSVRFADLVVPQLQLSLGYAEKLCADIPDAKFAHCPTPNVNHPAFCIGHLSIYADRIFDLTGRGDLAKPDPKFTELFKAGAPCVEQDGRYPAKSAIVGRYLERWKALAAALPGMPEEIFAKPNPAEGRMKDLMPTLGAMVSFLCCGHHMMHLGQISTWRRLVGLGPVM